MVEFKIGEDRRKTAIKASNLDIVRAEFRLLRDLVIKFSGEAAFEGIRIHQYWLLFKYHLIGAQEQAIPKCQADGAGGWLGWIGILINLELRQKEKAYSHWKKDQVIQKDYRNAINLCKEKRYSNTSLSCDLQLPYSIVGRNRKVMFFLIPFCDHVTHLVDQGKPIHVISLNFEAFNTISHNILFDKTSSIWLYENG